MRKPSSLLTRSKPYAAVLAFTLPALIFYLVFKIWPIFYGAFLSFHKWNFIAEPQWVGLSNFLSMFDKKQFVLALKNTGIYIVAMLPFFIVFPLLIALAVDSMKNKPFQSFSKTMMFVPTILAFSIISIVWLWMYNERYGVLNNMLRMLGFEGYAWAVDKRTAIVAVVLVSGWKSLGSNMILFIAGLVNIPREYIEAAYIDGCNAWQCFWRVKLPLLSSTLIYMITTSIVLASETVFAPINLITMGGPNWASSNLTYLIYKYAFSYFNIGMASAIALFTFVLFVAITLGLNKALRRLEY